MGKTRIDHEKRTWTVENEFDFLGWGSSDKPSGYPYTTANQVGDLDAVINQLRLGQVILVAHDASVEIGMKKLTTSASRS